VIKSESGEIVHQDSEKSERFNSFFFSVFVHYNGTIPPVTRKARTDSFTDIAFAFDDVFNALAKLKSKNSCGPDGRSSAFLKNCLQVGLFHSHLC